MSTFSAYSTHKSCEAFLAYYVYSRTGCLARGPAVCNYQLSSNMLQKYYSLVYLDQKVETVVVKCQYCSDVSF